jgi:alkylhydroperoxidase/carboxymuconolactone decarboxylase family protein YurZ
MRRLALNDESAIESALHVSIVDALEGLDAKTGALVRLAGLIALQSCDSSLEWGGVSTAVAAGATDEEIVAVVVVVAPIVGSSRTSCCAAAIASVLGHGLDLPE